MYDLYEAYETWHGLDKGDEELCDEYDDLTWCLLTAAEKQAAREDAQAAQDRLICEMLFLRGTLKGVVLA